MKTQQSSLFQFAKSVFAVDLQQSDMLCYIAYVHMQGDVAHNMYSIPTVYQRIFNQLI